jgi:hypothetical protein
MTNSTENSEKTVRLDDVIRSERYFTATLLPAVLFHNDLQGVKQFVDLVEEKATGLHDCSGAQGTKGTAGYDFKDVEVITEFHIARDLIAADLQLCAAKVASEESERERRDAPDLVIIAGQGLVVCEGKFFSNLNWNDLNNQLISQRSQVCHLLLNRPKILGYRHVAIVPEKPPYDIGADAVLTWDDIRELAEKLMAPEHYVTARLRNAVKRYEDSGDLCILNYDEILSFDAMRKRCRELGEIEVGIVGGGGALRKPSLVEAVTRQWKCRNPNNRGRVDPTNWLKGTLWLEIVESRQGFGGDAR